MSPDPVTSAVAVMWEKSFLIGSLWIWPSLRCWSQGLHVRIIKALSIGSLQLQTVTTHVFYFLGRKELRRHQLSQWNGETLKLRHHVSPSYLHPQRWRENIWYQRRGPVPMSAFSPNPQISIQVCSFRHGLAQPRKVLANIRNTCCVYYFI